MENNSPFISHDFQNIHPANVQRGDIIYTAVPTVAFAKTVGKDVVLPALSPMEFVMWVEFPEDVKPSVPEYSTCKVLVKMRLFDTIKQVEHFETLFLHVASDDMFISVPIES